MLAIVGVIFSFITVILVLNRWHNFGLAMLVGSLLMAVTGGFSPAEIWQILWKGATGKSSLQLVLVVALINMLGHILKQTGALEKLVRKMLAVLKDVRILVVAIPAVIGLLPVPGGAVMSAPLVSETGKKAGLSPERQAASNILYRHMLYLIFPLYPTLILAQDLSGISVGAFARHQLIPLVAGLLVSLVMLFYGTEIQLTEPDPQGKWFQSLTKLLYYSSPILIVLALVIALKVHFSLAAGLGIIWALMLDLKSKAEFVERVRAHLLPGLDWNLVIAVLGVMIFRGYVEGSGAMDVMARYLDQVGVPVLLLAIVLPILTGMTTGSSLAGVGVLFPIFLPLVPPGVDRLPFLSLIFVSTLIGYIASPVHICLVLTREICQACIRGVYLYLLPPLATILVTTIILVIT